MARSDLDPDVIEAKRLLAIAEAECDRALELHHQAIENLNQSIDKKERVAKQITTDRADARRTGKIPVVRENSGIFQVPLLLLGGKTG
jgi:hypothetical protein